ncbi:hypothetical protein N9139_01845 [Akkermansiaceae bacterium]|nr:hypothetical protein [Akkermansiaceae bacterium]
MTFAFIDSRSVEILLSGAELDKEQVEKVLKKAKFEVANSGEMDSLPL